MKWRLAITKDFLFNKPTGDTARLSNYSHRAWFIPLKNLSEVLEGKYLKAPYH